MSGKVYLVGAGPGDPDLLTRKAARILESARVVLHDALVSREVLELIPAKAERIDVGKRCGLRLLTQDEINALLISRAATCEVVVRLKGGDPTIFGRAGEEIEALREAAVEFEIVPGITAATAAAAAAGITLTDRRAASQVLLTTAHRSAESGRFELGSVTSATTLVIYMPGSDYGRLVEQLRGGGWPADMPCAIISAASGAKQKIVRANLGALGAEPPLPAPALLIVGRVAAERLEEAGKKFWQRFVAGEAEDRIAPAII